jgi:D-aminopeptidase
MSLDLLRLRRALRHLLASYDVPGSPGASIGILRGDALLAQESAGLASIELGVPIGPDTAFRIASVSKQFTCAAILLLAREGKLSVEDDIRRHLPELPEFGATVTLAHCMRNSSGLRDMLELMRLGGVELAEPVSADDLLAAVGRQRSLNFAPGSRFLYSNTGFMLLGCIVERVSGQPFGRFLAQRLFTPAGMTCTRHVASTAELVPGLACGYLPGTGGGFRRARHAFPLGGEGGLVSTVEDLALWVRHLTRKPALDDALQAQAAFPDGSLNAYANGVEVRYWRGLRTVSHGGLWPGFKTCFLRLPAHDLAVIAIANHGGIDAHHLAHQALDLVLEGTAGVAPRPALPAGLARLTGRWIATEGTANFDFELDAEGTPWVTQHGLPFALVSTEDGRLAARRAAIEFILEPADEALLLHADAGQRTTFRRAPAEAALPIGLAGQYRCAELGTDWTVTMQDDAPVVLVRGPLRHAGPWRLEPIAPDLMRLHVPGDAWQSWFDVAVRRDSAGKATALEAHGARARNLVFGRLG